MGYLDILILLTNAYKVPILEYWNSKLLFVKRTKINNMPVNYLRRVLGRLMSTIPGLSVTQMNILLWYLTQISAYLASNNSAKNL